MTTTSITPADIAVELGRPAPPAPTAAQWQQWIDDAMFLIDRRVVATGVTDPLDQQAVDYVVRHAVAAQVRRPDDATQVTVAVDDGSTSRLYRSGAGRVTILDEWWDLLGLGATTSGRAFEVDTMPADAAGVYGRDYVWTTTTDRTWL